MSTYIPAKVWKPEAFAGGNFIKTNYPTAGARFDRELPRGKHPLQLYSMGTPNGVKVTIMLEELLAANQFGAEYDAHFIDISKGDQFSSGFVGLNPNSKIPALIDASSSPEVPIFESGAILLYLAEKFDRFLPVKNRQDVLNWLFWQMGSAPYLGGGFGHFYYYAPVKIEYAINRFTMETKRQLDLLDKQLSLHEFIACESYTIADMAIWPWYGSLVIGDSYDASEFLDVASYKNLNRWADQVLKRPAVLKGRLVNRTWGDEDQQLRERHDQADFDHLNIDFRRKNN